MTTPGRDLADPRPGPSREDEVAPDPDGPVVFSTEECDAAARIGARARAVRDEQLAAALRALETDGELGGRERLALARLADRVAHRVVAPAVRAAREGDEERARAVASLFEASGRAGRTD